MARGRKVSMKCNCKNCGTFAVIKNHSDGKHVIMKCPECGREKVVLKEKLPEFDINVESTTNDVSSDISVEHQEIAIEVNAGVLPANEANQNITEVTVD